MSPPIRKAHTMDNSTLRATLEKEALKNPKGSNLGMALEVLNSSETLSHIIHVNGGNNHTRPRVDLMAFKLIAAKAKAKGVKVVFHTPIVPSATKGKYRRMARYRENTEKLGKSLVTAWGRNQSSHVKVVDTMSLPLHYSRDGLHQTSRGYREILLAGLKAEKSFG